jgi:hypothetical protein
MYEFFITLAIHAYLQRDFYLEKLSRTLEQCAVEKSRNVQTFPAKIEGAAKDGGVNVEFDYLKYRPVKLNTGEGMVLDRAEYAWKISKGDLGFVKLLDAENGAWTIDNINYNRNGTTDMGIGQINSIHSAIRNDPEWQTSWKKQVEVAYELYKGGTTFYAQPRANWKLEKKELPCPDWLVGC